MAFKIADGYVEVHGRVDEGSFKRAAKEAVDGFGDSGDKAGDAFVKAFGRAASRSGGGGGGRQRAGIWTQIRRMFTPDPGLMKSLMHPLEKALSVPIVAALSAGIVGLGSSAIAAAISSAVLLGVGGLVLGPAAALLSDKLKPTFERAMGTMGKVLKRAALPLQNEFAQALRSIALLVMQLEGQFRAIFKAGEPIVPLLVDIFSEFAREILPTIGQIMPFVVDMFETLAARAPELADSITKVLKAMADEETITAFNYLLTGLVFTIEFVASAIGALTRAFNNDIEDLKEGTHRAKELIADIKGALAKIPVKKITKYLFQPGAALTLIPGLVGKIRRIPLRTWTKYLFQPGAALSWISRVTGATKHIPRWWRTTYRFLGSIGPIRNVINWIARIPRNVTTTLTSVTRNITESITRFANPFARASGGIIGTQGMATGGISGSRSVLVGEQGPEMVNLPFGSRVTPAGQTRAQLGQGGQAGRVVLEINSGGSRLDDVLVELLRKSIRARAGGRPNSVQVVLGN